MRRYSVIALAVFSCVGLFSTFPATAQQLATQRKIISKAVPLYPELARHMKLEGVVRLEVIVTPSGSVKSMRPLGGSPLLLRAAQDAIPKWKWAPATQESTELVELTFHPN